MMFLIPLSIFCLGITLVDIVVEERDFRKKLVIEEN